MKLHAALLTIVSSALLLFYSPTLLMQNTNANATYSYIPGYVQWENNLVFNQEAFSLWFKYFIGMIVTVMTTLFISVHIVPSQPQTRTNRALPFNASSPIRGRPQFNLDDSLYLAPDDNQNISSQTPVQQNRHPPNPAPPQQLAQTQNNQIQNNQVQNIQPQNQQNTQPMGMTNNNIYQPNSQNATPTII